MFPVLQAGRDHPANIVFPLQRESCFCFFPVLYVQKSFITGQPLGKDPGRIGYRAVAVESLEDNFYRGGGSGEGLHPVVGKVEVPIAVGHNIFQTVLTFSRQQGEIAFAFDRGTRIGIPSPSPEIFHTEFLADPPGFIRLEEELRKVDIVIIQLRIFPTGNTYYGFGMNTGKGIFFF